MRILSLFFAVTAAVFFSGCATMLAPGPDEFSIVYEPSSADVMVDGQSYGKTPARVTLDRGAECLIQVSMDGYESQTVDHGKVVNGWLFGNLILVYGAVIGIAIDLISNNQGKFSSSPVNVKLVKSSPAGSPPREEPPADDQVAP